MPDPPRQLPDILNIKTSFYFFTPVSCHFSLSIAYLPSCPRNISGLKNLQGQNQTTFSHYTIIYFSRIANHFFRKKLFRSKKLPYFCIFCIKNHSCPVKNSDKRKNIVCQARRLPTSAQWTCDCSAGQSPCTRLHKSVGGGAGSEQ